jgi:hypothetical protein
MSSTGGFGPDFQNAGSRLYRIEYAGITVAILAYLVYRWLYLGGVDWLSTAFWAIFPDLAAFIPIGLSPSRREWPAWGAPLYNAVHTLLSWGFSFSLIWFALRTPYWPILGWLGHITTDRAVGYGLRTSSRTRAGLADRHQTFNKS